MGQLTTVTLDLGLYGVSGDVDLNSSSNTNDPNGGLLPMVGLLRLSSILTMSWVLLLIMWIIHM